MRSASNDIDLLFLRSQCFYAMGDIQNCTKHLQQCVRFDPDNTIIINYYRKTRDIEARKESGSAAFKRNEYNEAVVEWSTCIDLSVDSPAYVAKVYYNRACAYLKLKNFALAVSDCDRAIAIDSEYGKAIMKRADAFVALGGKDMLENAIKYVMYLTDPNNLHFQFTMCIQSLL